MLSSSRAISVLGRCTKNCRLWERSRGASSLPPARRRSRRSGSDAACRRRALDAGEGARRFSWARHPAPLAPSAPPSAIRLPPPLLSSAASTPPKTGPSPRALPGRPAPSQSRTRLPPLPISCAGSTDPQARADDAATVFLFPPPPSPHAIWRSISACTSR